MLNLLTGRQGLIEAFEYIQIMFVCLIYGHETSTSRSVGESGIRRLLSSDTLTAKWLGKRGLRTNASDRL